MFMATCLRMLLRVPIQSDNSFNMVRPLVAAGTPAIQNKRLDLDSRTTRLRTAFKAAAEPTRFQIKRYCGGALRCVNWVTSAQAFLSFLCRHAACWYFSYLAGDAAVSAQHDRRL
jgi:hypothetical protein